MRFLVVFFIGFTSIFPGILSAQDTAVAAATKTAGQLILVTTKSWESVPGEMRCYERNAKSGWQQIKTTIPVVVGRNGLAWGGGLHATNHLQGPVKREGDGKSPAGFFLLGSSFGLEAREKVSGIKLPYLQLTSEIECVDDVNSTHYNTMVDRKQILQPDWNSSEKMKAIGEQYRWGIVVNHNVAPRQNGCGSCIFLHIWKNSKTGTSGCTAMKSENIVELLHWLDPEKKPVLVQLPESEYTRLKSEWRLPEIVPKK